MRGPYPTSCDRTINTVFVDYPLLSIYLAPRQAQELVNDRMYRDLLA